MNIRDLSKDKIENMSHIDIAYNLIKTDKKMYNTLELIKEVCKLLEIDESNIENLIGDFYTLLNVDKRFIFLDGKWDLTENHAVKIVVDDDGDDEVDDYEDIDEDEEDSDIAIEDDAVLEEEMLEDMDDELDDDMGDLSIMSEEELEEEEEETL